MTSPIFFYVIASLFGLLTPLLLDAYSFREEAIELTKYLAGFLVGVGLAKVIL